MQVMLQDGSFADYIVKTERDSDIYQIFKGESLLATFKTSGNGDWSVTDNPGKVNSDLESRIKEQLKGLRT